MSHKLQATCMRADAATRVHLSTSWQPVKRSTPGTSINIINASSAVRHVHRASPAGCRVLCRGRADGQRRGGHARRGQPSHGSRPAGPRERQRAAAKRGLAQECRDPQCAAPAPPCCASASAIEDAAGIANAPQHGCTVTDNCATIRAQCAIAVVHCRLHLLCAALHARNAPGKSPVNHPAAAQTPRAKARRRQRAPTRRAQTRRLPSAMPAMRARPASSRTCSVT